VKTLYTPEPARIKKVVPQTELETLFEIELLERSTLGHKPGQFVEVSVLGVGEAPLSISSAPALSGSNFELCVRRAGNVTGAFSNMKEGDHVGIRGPFGNGFDTDVFKGRDVMFVAGGIGLVPLRSFINDVLNHRGEYGKVFILYGCKRPKDILFEKELILWESLEGIELLTTVDVAGDDWNGNVGVITTLMPHVAFDPRNTEVVIVGPPVMYRFIISELRERQVPEKNMWVSLERRMKCGVGKCGHCQMNGIYVCSEGPVFNYAELKGIPEAI
jgi:sulfhydrogenase subunit gamma (sulfur reductase)